jgi:hypothetical protein
MDSFPPGEEGPRYEMMSIGRSLSDTAVARRATLPPRVIIAQLCWTALAVVALMAFVGWLLVG